MPKISCLIVAFCVLAAGCSDHTGQQSADQPAARAAVARDSAPVTPPASTPLSGPPGSTAPAVAAPPAPATVMPAPEVTSAAEPAYSVECPAAATAAEQCQVDKTTYVGWRTFAGQCQVCHGGSALGSTFAPNLLDRFHSGIDHARFVEVVKNGFRGQVGAMPAWKGNPNVEPHIDALYAYLKARADHALPAGRPARKP